MLGVYSPATYSSTEARSIQTVMKSKLSSAIFFVFFVDIWKNFPGSCIIKAVYMNLRRYFPVFNQGQKILPHQNKTQRKKMKFSIKEFFSKFDQIRKSLIENFIFCVVKKP